MSATASIASFPKARVTPSVFKSSTYWRMRAFRGSLRMRIKSSRVKGSSSTRMGKRPCSSGMRSDGLETWKAPAAMNKMWSVRTIPYLVVTVEPSTMGRRSRCTPSRETSGPCTPSRPATLSSSSRKMIPESSTRRMACATASSTSTSFCASSWARSRRASPTLSRRRRVLFGRMLASMSLMLMPTSSIPCPENTSNIGPVWACTSTSICRSSSLPARSCPRSFSRVASREKLRGQLQGVAGEGFTGTAGQQEVEDTLFGQVLGALAHGEGHLGLDHVHRQLGQIADHGLHIAAHVADLGVLGRFHLQEGRLGELGEAAGDLRLPHPRGPDHDDVLGRDFVAELRGKILAAPAVAQRDGHRLLGEVLAHDVAVELGHDLRGGERRGEAHGWSVSTVICSLV